MVFKQDSESHQSTDPSSQQKARTRPVRLSKMQGNTKRQSQKGGVSWPLQLPLRNSPSSPTSNSGPSSKRSKNSQQPLRISGLPPCSNCQDVQFQEASSWEYCFESSRGVSERRSLTPTCTDGNSPIKSSQRSSKGSASDRERTQSPSQAEICLDDLEWEFEDEQLLMSTEAN
jgi:hypothetical protein